MPERNHEVVIDGYVFPDTVTVTLANDEYVNSRDYVSKELYESVFDANDAWQSENAKLRELVKAFWWCTENFDTPNKCDRCPLGQSDKLTPECEVRMRELGVEAGDE